MTSDGWTVNSEELIIESYVVGASRSLYVVEKVKAVLEEIKSWFSSNTCKTLQKNEVQNHCQSAKFT